MFRYSDKDFARWHTDAETRNELTPMSDKSDWWLELNEYIRQSGPSRAEKGAA